MATVTRLYDSHTQALQAVSDLEAAGFKPDDISIVSNNADNWHA
ncbi:MAG: general stress protein, partial [Brevundimonas sp.]